MKYAATAALVWRFVGIFIIIAIFPLLIPGAIMSPSGSLVLASLGIAFGSGCIVLSIPLGRITSAGL